MKKYALVFIIAVGLCFSAVTARLGATPAPSAQEPASTAQERVPAALGAEVNRLPLQPPFPGDPGVGTAFSHGYLRRGEMEIPPGIRTLVFSPHPDDETIAAGGFIQRVHEKEGNVRVVFMTNGDGYVAGVRLAVHRPVVSSEDYVRYGVKRHDEALKAACDLGINPQDVIYLGFPDDGLDRLWTSHWSRLHAYTSPHTLYSHAPYTTSFIRTAKYDGLDLDREIERIIRVYKPDWVILPDPRDWHPDHAATGVFVLDALRRLDDTGEISLQDMQVFSYLVHYGDYPKSNVWTKHISGSGVNSSPYASGILADTQWVSLPLTPEEQAEKKLALGDYGTQLLVLGDFLKQFLRPSEHFGRMDAEQILAVPLEYAGDHRRWKNPAPSVSALH